MVVGRGLNHPLVIIDQKYVFVFDSLTFNRFLKNLKSERTLLKSRKGARIAVFLTMVNLNFKMNS